MQNNIMNAKPIRYFKSKSGLNNFSVMSVVLLNTTIDVELTVIKNVTNFPNLRAVFLVNLVSDKFLLLHLRLRRFHPSAF